MADHNHGKKDDHGGGHSHHYILPDRKAILTGVALLVLTVVTVALSYVDLGALNFIVGMLVATVKAGLVVMIFMNLSHDSRANLVIFLSSILFLVIFYVLTVTDLYFRGDVYVGSQPLFRAVSGGPAKFKKPWVPTPEIISHGAAIYASQCVSCHGAAGLGDGPAAGTLNPRPRNFTADAGWVNGRKPSQIYKTLKEGIPNSGMSSFATLPAEDRWTLSHYVASLGPNVMTDTNEDLAKVEIDPTKDTIGEVAAKSIPVSVAMQLMAKDAEARPVQQAETESLARDGLENYRARLEARTFSK